MGKLHYFAASMAAGALVLLGACAKTPVTQAKSVTQVQKPVAVAPLNTPITGAAFTTINTSVDGPDHCKNGNGDTNCNIYDGKQYVWLNGGPSVAYVGDGDYFFAVLVPGGQPDPNDSASKNLSDDYDAYTNRTFSVNGGTVSYSGNHDFDSNKIRLMPYGDTTNPGGVYIMAICSLADGYPVNPSDCKYDAFKILKQDETPPASGLTIVKDADGSYANTYKWSIDKSADKTLVENIGGGQATFNYTVSVSHDGGTISAVKVAGTISVFNMNVDKNGNTVPVKIKSVTDVLSDGTACSVTDGSEQDLVSAQTDFAYTCELISLPQGALDNTATVTWEDQTINGSDLAGGHADFTFTGIKFTGTDFDEAVTVTDTYAGQLGTVDFQDASPTDFTYSRTVDIPLSNCVKYDNTATFTTNDHGKTGSDSQTVEVCGPAKTGALTIGFWSNKNGQSIITGGGSTSGNCNSGTWLRKLSPFEDLSASATCSQVGAYFLKIFKAADASGAAMNAMLKAQMLATALNVYFSDDTLGGNKINAPKPIGGVKIDLTKIYKKVANVYEDVSSAFGNTKLMSVLDMLTYAASQSSSGGSNWYLQVKATQELAKDAFDAVNNQWAFAP